MNMNTYGQIYSIQTPSVTYIGKAFGSALKRWSEHIRQLRGGTHHCEKLQEEFDTVGICEFKFQILKDKVPIERLTYDEYDLSVKAGSINSLPSHIVKEVLRGEIIEDIRSGKTYREISKSRGVSLGSISNIKSQSYI